MLLQTENTIVTVSWPPAGMVVLVASTFTPLPLVDQDQVKFAVLELFVKVTIQLWIPVFGSFVHGCVAKNRLVGLTEMVGGGWTVRITTTVAVFEPILMLMLP